ncbi:MAG TPA: phosphohistidine phosphatase SixA [Bryobacteraceae bacterium]|jgi:phosphohistidine phosphatase|nr:phosphohistidine phosphatase SixA [Bryobacteraceae bacterium]
MDLYLLRHGIAEEPRPNLSDPERALTKEGKEKLRRILKRAREAGVAPTLILSSPLRRAIETAEIAAEILEYSGEIARTPALIPNASPSVAWDEIRSHAGEDSIVLASHEPLMSSLLAHLLNSPSLQTDFKKGAIARVECASTGPAPRCVLKWMLTASLA